MSDIRNKMERLLQGNNDDRVRASRQPPVHRNNRYTRAAIREAIEHYFDPVYEICDACRGSGVMIPGLDGTGSLFPGNTTLRSDLAQNVIPRLCIRLTPVHVIAVSVASTKAVINTMSDLIDAKLRCRLVEQSGSGRSLVETDLVNIVIHNEQQLMEWFHLTISFAAELQANANELDPNDVQTYWQRRRHEDLQPKTPPQPEAVTPQDDPPVVPIERDRVIMLRGELTEESSDASCDKET